MNISLDKTIRAMSIALDLAEISSVEDVNIIENISNVNYSNHDFLNHSKRTTYISLKLANKLNLDNEVIKELYIASLLHDIGAANFLKKSHSSNSFIKEHSIDGADIIQSFPIFSNISNIILYHHENFDGSGPMEISGNNIPLQSQIIRIADLIELLFDAEVPIYRQKDHIISWVKLNEASIFSKEIIDVFLNISSKDIFWFDLENIAFMDFILDSISPKLDVLLNLEQFETIAHIMSKIIDHKSNFTAMHSIGIAELAYKVSCHIGYSEEKCLKMKIAGLLHDIGKLAIPSNILDKNDSLSNDEFSIIKSHVYYTKIILDRIDDIKEISDWASNHHEKLNGKGYPRGLDINDLSDESKIMCVCDIYQALTEDRPYRNGLSNDQALNILNDMVKDGFICGISLQYLKDTLF